MSEKLNKVMDNIKKLRSVQTKVSGFNESNGEFNIEDLVSSMEDLDNILYDQKAGKLNLEYTNDSDNKEPEYAYDSDSGFDLRSTEDVWVQGNDRKLVPTGLRFDIPDGYEIQVRSKSGLALKQGLMVLNSPGTVDSGYQGEVKVIIFNTTKERIKIEKGQKIAQAVLCPVVNGKWVNLIKVEEIGEKDRNDKGFGSTNLF
jgi:dUTP pyrophosphatase